MNFYAFIISVPNIDTPPLAFCPLTSILPFFLHSYLLTDNLSFHAFCHSFLDL